jgi:hypothetical protein
MTRRDFIKTTDAASAPAPWTIVSVDHETISINGTLLRCPAGVPARISGSGGRWKIARGSFKE